VRQVLAKARVGLPVEKFNMDGTPMTASAVPPSPPGAPATDLPPTPGVTPAVPK
jgi:hypothetical protein